MGFYYTALVSQTLVLHEWVCLENHGGVIDAPWADQTVPVIQAPAVLYERALGMGAGYWVREALLIFQWPSDLIHTSGCFL